MTVFTTVAEAAAIPEAWRHGYNEERLHSSWGYGTAPEFKADWEDAHRPGGDPGIGLVA